VIMIIVLQESKDRQKLKEDCKAFCRCSEIMEEQIGQDQTDPQVCRVEKCALSDPGFFFNRISEAVSLFSLWQFSILEGKEDGALFLRWINWETL